MTILSKWNGVPQNGADLTLKFGKTCVLAKTEKDPDAKVYYIKQVDSISVHTALLDTLFGEGEFWALFNKNAKLLPTPKFDVITPLPNPGIYQNGERVAFIRRIPARQYSEGFTPSNTFILLDGITQVKGEAVLGKLVLDLFAEQKNLTLREGLDRIKPRQSLRLNERYWLKEHGKDITLFRNRTDVGTWSCGAFYWSAMTQMLGEELKDELDFNAHQP